MDSDEAEEEGSEDEDEDEEEEGKDWDELEEEAKRYSAQNLRGTVTDIARADALVCLLRVPECLCACSP